MLEGVLRAVLAAFLLCVALVLSEVPLGVSLRTVFFIGFQILGGVGTIHLLFRRSGCTMSPITPIAFAVGMVQVSLLHVLLVPVGFQGLSPFIPAIALFFFRKSNSAGQNDRQSQLWLEFMWVISLGLLVLGRVYRWQIVVAAVMIGFCLGLTWYLNSRNSTLLRRMSLLSIPAAVGILVAIAKWSAFYSQRPRWWWTINSDITFTEAATRTLSGWGLGDHVAAAGRASFAEYHWMPFAWTGALDRFVGADPWVVNTRVSQLILVIMSTWLIWGFLQKLFFRNVVWTAVSTGVAALVAIPIGVNFTHLFGIFWFLVLLSLIVSRESSWSNSCLLAMFGVGFLGLLLSKPQIAVPSVIAAVVVSLVSKPRPWNILAFLRDPVVAAGTVSAGIVWMIHRVFENRFPNLSGAVKMEIVSVGSFGEIGNARNLFALPLALVSLGYLTVPALALAVITSRRSVNRTYILFLMAAGVVGLFMMMTTSADYSQIAGYVVSFVGSVIGLLLGVLLQSLNTVDVRIRTVLPIAVIAIAGQLIMDSWPSLFEFGADGSVVNMSLRVLAGQRWIPVFFAVLIGGVLFAWLTGDTLWSGVGRLAPMFFIVGVAISIVPVESLIKIASSPNPVIERAEARFIAFSDVDSEFIDQVKRNVKPQQIIASNVFCPSVQIDSCIDPDWWANYESVVQRDLVPVHCVSSFKVAVDASLPAVFNRRFLIQAPNFFDPCGEFPEWLNESIMHSEQFGRFASPQSFEYLCENSVEWFIADRLTSSVSTWEPFGEVIAMNPRLELVQLDADECVNALN